MKTIRNALLGACMALPLAAFAGHAQAAQPDGTRTITVPPGAVVLILPDAPPMVTAAAPNAAPILRMIAQQEAAMQQMFANMNTMFPPMPDPNQLLRAAFGPGLLLGGPMVVPAGAGQNVCSQSISIVERGDGGKPIVHVSQSGNACGPMGIGKPEGVNQIQPVPHALPPHGPRVLDIGYPPHPVSTGVPPRT